MTGTESGPFALSLSRSPPTRTYESFTESGIIRDVRAEEQGWVDTVTTPPGDITSVVAHFGEHDGLFRNITGRYVWHCHMLEHANHEMIRPMEVDPEGYSQE